MENLIIPPWFSHISSAQRKQSKHEKSLWIQLATVGIDNTPRVRTVVFRGWSGNYELQLFTDKRSQKIYELQLNNNVEICWFFSCSKCQFRLRGRSKVDTSEDSLSKWEQLNNKTRAMWGWPTPGEKFLSSKKVYLFDKDNICKSTNFNLLKIDITHVDQLILHKPIHTRRRWIKRKEWIEERINP